MSPHRFFSLWNMLQRHFPNNALLNRLISFIPSPPCAFERHILSQLIQAILLC
uniref:Uncharacterized protein n=1 Tax=Cajanus cajan TaxID=3821 RepID=A0A151TES8_CAJCA|nr:hypothetical protein KK1_017043 [Cajanus cajan]KYP65545.1 hypothetical protein KK1_011787 [Cajanus cajan]